MSHRKLCRYYFCLGFLEVTMTQLWLRSMQMGEQQEEFTWIWIVGDGEMAGSEFHFLSAFWAFSHLVISDRVQLALSLTSPLPHWGENEMGQGWKKLVRKKVHITGNIVPGLYIIRGNILKVLRNCVYKQRGCNAASDSTPSFQVFYARIFEVIVMIMKHISRYLFSVYEIYIHTYLYDI